MRLRAKENPQKEYKNKANEKLFTCKKKVGIENKIKRIYNFNFSESSSSTILEMAGEQLVAH